MAIQVGSIISQSLKNLTTQFKASTNYIDLRYAPPTNTSETLEVSGGAVFVNDLELWLQSGEADYMGRDFGGWLDKNIRNYPLTLSGGQQLGSALASAIETAFPTLQLMLLEVTPDVANRGWKILVVVQDTITGFLGKLSTGLAVPT